MIEVCDYCKNTGLSIIAGAGLTLSICNVCQVGKSLQKFLTLLAQAEAKNPIEVKGLIAELKRIVEI